MIGHRPLLVSKMNCLWGFCQSAPFFSLAACDWTRSVEIQDAGQHRSFVKVPADVAVRVRRKVTSRWSWKYSKATEACVTSSTIGHVTRKFHISRHFSYTPLGYFGA